MHISTPHVVLGALLTLALGACATPPVRGPHTHDATDATGAEVWTLVVSGAT